VAGIEEEGGGEVVLVLALLLVLGTRAVVEACACMYGQEG